MSDPTSLKCERCSRSLHAERPVRLPDTHVYCSACCESMAAADFEMETGELFTRWIERHPELVMKYQPLELTVRRFGFFFPMVLSVAGLALIVYGITQCIRFEVSPAYLLLGLAVPAVIVAAWFVYTKQMIAGTLIGIRILMFLFVAGIPVYGFFGCMKYGFPFGYIVLG